MDLPELRKRAFLRGLALRCPQCGERGLFRAFGRLRDACGTCGLVLRREQGAQTGSMYLTAAITQVVACVLIFAVWFGTDWSVGTSIAVVLPLTGVVCACVLPVSQASWVAVEYVTDAINDEPWVDPRA